MNVIASADADVTPLYVHSTSYPHLVFLTTDIQNRFSVCQDEL